MNTLICHSGLLPLAFLKPSKYHITVHTWFYREPNWWQFSLASPPQRTTVSPESRYNAHPDRSRWPQCGYLAQTRPRLREREVDEVSEDEQEQRWWEWMTGTRVKPLDLISCLQTLNHLPFTRDLHMMVRRTGLLLNENFKIMQRHQTGQRKIWTRAGVNETLCPQHMLATYNNIKMIPNLQRATTPEIVYGIGSNVNQVYYSSSPISWPSSKPLAQTVFEISCW